MNNETKPALSQDQLKRLAFLSLSNEEKMKHCVFCGEEFGPNESGHINCGGKLLDVKLPAEGIATGAKIVESARAYLNEQEPKNWAAVEVLNKAWGLLAKEYFKVEPAAPVVQPMTMFPPLGDRSLHFEDAEVLTNVKDSEYAKSNIQHHLMHMTCNEKWSLYRAIVEMSEASQPTPVVVPETATTEKMNEPKPLCKCGHTFFMHDGGGLEGCDESNGKDFCECMGYEPEKAPIVVRPEETRAERQKVIGNWCVDAFGADEARSLPQRGIRLLEEAAEAAQVTGVDLAMAHKMLDYVWSRPVGRLDQELGGAGVTVLALAEAAGISADGAELNEVARVLAKPISHFAQRNQAKNDAGFLTAQPAPLPSNDTLEDPCKMCRYRGYNKCDKSTLCANPAALPVGQKDTFEEWWKEYSDSPEFLMADDSRETSIAAWAAAWNAVKGQKETK